MYENVTFESILDRMLEKVPDSMDKREGSIIYDALAPAAVELQLMYIELDVILKETFSDTASREYLIRRAAERGIEPFPASKAILKATYTPTSIDIPIGSRFSLNELNYVVLEKIGDGQLKIECERLGKSGNGYFGNVIPIEYIEGLETMQITELLIPGEDEEDTEDFRKRYHETIMSEAFGGNIADYKEKVRKIKGVSGVKVYPVYFGPGTVKLVIINSEYDVPSSSLVDQVQNDVDPKENTGKGVGIAPIGHKVTVEGVKATTININTKITYQKGFEWSDVRNSVEKAIDDYFKSLAKEWDENTNLIVRISHIETKLLGINGILDVQNTTINDEKLNISLDENNIPKRGVVNG